MGRNQKNAKKSKIKFSSQVSPSISSLLTKAQSLVAQCDYELALRFIQRVLDIQPENVEAREMKGVVETETGDLIKAKEVRSSHYDRS